MKFQARPQAVPIPASSHSTAKRQPRKQSGLWKGQYRRCSTFRLWTDHCQLCRWWLQPQGRLVRLRTSQGWFSAKTHCQGPFVARSRGHRISASDHTGAYVGAQKSWHCCWKNRQEHSPRQRQEGWRVGATTGGMAGMGRQARKRLQAGGTVSAQVLPPPQRLALQHSNCALSCNLTYLGDLAGTSNYNKLAVGFGVEFWVNFTVARSKHALPTTTNNCCNGSRMMRPSHAVSMTPISNQTASIPCVQGQGGLQGSQRLSSARGCARLALKAGIQELIWMRWPGYSSHIPPRLRITGH